HRSAQEPRKGPHVVEAIQMIGVEMGEEDRVNELHFLPQQLQPQLGRRVDQQIALRQADENGAAIALIARVRGLAYLAIAANHGDADGGAGAERGEGPPARHCVAISRSPALRGNVRLARLCLATSKNEAEPRPFCVPRRSLGTRSQGYCRKQKKDFRSLKAFGSPAASAAALHLECRAFPAEGLVDVDSLVTPARFIEERNRSEDKDQGQRQDADPAECHRKANLLGV